MTGLKSPCVEDDGKRVTLVRARSAAEGWLADTGVNLPLPWAVLSSACAIHHR